MHPFLKRFTPEKSALPIIFYKLSAECFVLILVVGALIFLSEMILPGFVTRRINFSDVYLIMTLAALSTLALAPAAERARSGLTKLQVNTRLSPFLLAFASLLLVFLLSNDTHGENWLQRGAILIAVFLSSWAVLTFLFGRRQETKKPA